MASNNSTCPCKRLLSLIQPKPGILTLVDGRAQQNYFGKIFRVVYLTNHHTTSNQLFKAQVTVEILSVIGLSFFSYSLLSMD